MGKALERLFSSEKEEWSIELIRALFDEMLQGITRLSRSAEHECIWLSLTSFLMRPGFGFYDDQARVERVWRLTELGISHKREPRVLLQWCIFWRRIAGGLDVAQQVFLFDQINKMIAKFPSISREGFRTQSSLELVPVSHKIKLAENLVLELSRGKVEEAIAWSFGRVCSRTLRGSKAEVVAASLVEQFVLLLTQRSWRDPSFIPLAKACVQAARYVEDPNRDLSLNIRMLLSDKVKETTVGSSYAKLFMQHIPYDARDMADMLGDSLPIGIEMSQ